MLPANPGSAFGQDQLTGVFLTFTTSPTPTVGTTGKCQTETVKELLGDDPGRLIPGDSEAVQMAKPGGCTEVVALVSR